MRLGFDVTGTAMGLAIIFMTLLSAGSVVAGLILAVRQDWVLVVLGLFALLFCSVLARLLEALVVPINVAAVPVLVILVAEILCLRLVLGSDTSLHRLLVWLWGYGVATAPWTLFALRVGRFRRTLVGIRAYAGHVALWLFSILVLWLHVTADVATAAMLVPAILPFAVGLLLALADREAIANVHV